MDTLPEAQGNATRSKETIGVPAIYRFGGAEQPVRLLKISRGTTAIIVRGDGSIDQVPTWRVTLS